ncbi:hypothetical protein DFH09DRAFT_1457460 [Mycena vulgaris]|nr:hypothetical protein DFH09DRAFT_1457460 [Mycena vulgaris]
MRGVTPRAHLHSPPLPAQQVWCKRAHSTAPPSILRLERRRLVQPLEVGNKPFTNDRITSSLLHMSRVPSKIAPFISSGPVLPPEITDSIIHELSPDAPALRICSLVCHAWLPASRHILHKMVALRGEDIPDFLDLIAPSENTYLNKLRVIDISLCENGPAASLLELLPRFLCLESVRIHSSIFHYETPDLPRVRSLELFGLHFRSFAAFTNLLSRFPDLKNLILGENVLWGSVQGWAPTGQDVMVSKPSLPLQLNTFNAYISNNSQLQEWLGSGESGPIASNLTLVMPNVYSNTASALTADTLAKLSEYLRHLHLDFRPNTELKSLRLDFTLSGINSPSIWVSYFFTEFPDVLQSFRFNRFEELVIDLHAAPVFKKGISSDRLVAAFSDLPFSRLRKLQFNGPWDSSTFDARKKITRNVLDKLPPSASREVILFDPAAN